MRQLFKLTRVCRRCRQRRRAHAQVQESIAKAAEAQRVWAQSGWRQRKLLLRIFNKFMLENAETICRCAHACCTSGLEPALYALHRRYRVDRVKAPTRPGLAARVSQRLQTKRSSYRSGR